MRPKIVKGALCAAFLLPLAGCSDFIAPPESDPNAVPFATAEDLILHKLFAGRLRDLEDATAVVHRQREKLDWAYLERWGESFAEIAGREDLPDRLRKLRAS